MLRKYLLLFLTAFTFQSVSAQNNSTSPLSVYLDCRNCNDSFIRSEINFVSFVRDQADAEVHLLITSQRTGSGGQNYVLEYIGQAELREVKNTLEYTSFDSDTDDEERNGLVKHVKLGLVPYLAKRNALSDFDLNFIGNQDQSNEKEKNDRWNNWVFEIGGSGNFNGEESRKNRNLNGRIDARKTTEDIKIRLTFWENSSRQTLIRTDTAGVETKTIFDNNRTNGFGLIAWSLGDHWSIGSYFSGGASTRENIDFRIGATPSIEYSFYPYREFSRREVTLRYGLLSSYYNYTERTIYGKQKEFLTKQQLQFNMQYTKPWGGIEGRINASNYLHDFSKNNLLFDFEIDMRVVRGFNVFFGAFYEIINDQISLSAEGVTDADAIANTRQLATSYEYGGRIGFEITFGSIFDNVVNTRF